jgi:hypothetical protein
MLPKDYGADYGAASSMQSRMAMHGPMGMGRPNPHHVAQEIDFMNLALNMVRECHNMVMHRSREDASTIQRYQSQEVQLIQLTKDLMEDKREQERKDWMESAKVGALKMIAERVGVVAPPVLMRLQQWAAHKLGDGKKRTEREELAFGTLRGLVKRVQLQIKRMGGNERDPAALMNALKMMGIDEDDEILDDIRSLLIEFEIDEQTQKVVNVKNLFDPSPVVEPVKSTDTANAGSVADGADGVVTGTVEPKGGV